MPRGRGFGFRTGATVLACTAALALSSCSADRAESTETVEPAETTAPSTNPSVRPGAAELAEPQPSPIDVDGVSASGRKVLSEQGTGTATYSIEGGLEAGQSLSISVSCTPGETAAISRDLYSARTSCSTPASSVLYQDPDSEALPDVEFTVGLPDGSPYWVAAWVHDPQ
ncbi:hypothetical protein ACFFON_11430 [Arthrobacter citreus]|uniref:hypothetical protein n=1 Tax=Arthrobacter citreus TaxID=1670 RepID=UPI00126460C0